MSRSPYSTDHATHHLAQQSCSNPASTNGTSGASADYCFNGQVNAHPRDAYGVEVDADLTEAATGGRNPAQEAPPIAVDNHPRPPPSSFH